VSENRSNDLYVWKGNGNGTVASTINPLNQVESHGGVALAYDAKGNLTFDGTRSFAYTAENRLASGPGTNLYYDPLGRLVHLSGRGSNFHYDGADIIHESLPGGAIRRYVHGPGSDEPLVQYDGAGARNWLHADERGSIAALSDAAGNVTAVNRYDEYGVPAQTNAGLFQYTGQVWLGELGVYSYKARMYQPTLGRFLQPDPIGYGDGMNMYAYVGGDPVNFTDPDGTEKKHASAPSGLLVIGMRGGVTGGAALLGSRGARRGPSVGPEPTSEPNFDEDDDGRPDPDILATGRRVAGRLRGIANWLLVGRPLRSCEAVRAFGEAVENAGDKATGMLFDIGLASAAAASVSGGSSVAVAGASAIGTVFSNSVSTGGKFIQAVATGDRRRIGLAGFVTGFGTGASKSEAVQLLAGRASDKVQAYIERKLPKPKC
jgi:RHS repeat-associated protein